MSELMRLIAAKGELGHHQILAVKRRGMPQSR